MILPILHYPDKRLRTVAQPVLTVDKTIQTLVKNMFETMYSEDGIGLAATQINQHIQVVVMDVPGEQNDYQLLLKERSGKAKSKKSGKPLCFINPKIVEKQGSEIHIEGCLSVPGFHAEVKRFNQIKVEALDEKNSAFTLEATGLLAICIQHEIDHLNGILFVDHLSKLKQKRLLEKTKKTKKTAEA
ncbi:MAG: peptide deformylase [Candidatus Thioglobus sp.]|nr:peptide deformylase [Candidatus Thioglobus sp.]